MGNVTKKNLVEIVSVRTGLTQVDTKVIIENLLDTVSLFLVEGKNIEIRGFGRFKVKVKKGRIARNPRTGATVEVIDGLKPVFEASKELKKKINNGVHESEIKSGTTVQSIPESSEPVY
jgi:DNA-binding protein HU-beta/integration host factor subunit beta